MKVYEEVKQCVGFVVGHGNTSVEIERAMSQAVQESRFIFGNEIYRFLDEIYIAMIDVGTYEKERPGLHGDDLRDILELRRKAFDKVVAFNKEGPAKFETYMKLDQKMRRFPFF